MNGRFAVQIHGDANVGFLRFATDLCARGRCRSQLRGDLRPARRRLHRCAAPNAEIACELQIGVPIANDIAVVAIDGDCAFKYASSNPVFGLRHAQLSAAKCGQMNSASNTIPCDASSRCRNS